MGDGRWVMGDYARFDALLEAQLDALTSRAGPGPSFGVEGRAPGPAGADAVTDALWSLIEQARREAGQGEAGQGEAGQGEAGQVSPSFGEAGEAAEGGLARAWRECSEFVQATAPLGKVHLTGETATGR